MKILLIDSCYPINTRNSKMVHSFKSKGDYVCVCTWNRTSINNIQCQYEDKIYCYERKSQLGNKWAKLKEIRGYLKFIKKINNKENPDIIVASHYDMLFLASFIKGKKQKLLYENLDIPTSTNKLILCGLKKIERIALKKTDYIIHASRFYKPLYPFFKRPQFIIENHPKLFTEEEDHLVPENTFPDMIKLAFIGNVRYIEILINLAKAILPLNFIKVFIHGEGYQLNALKEFIRKNELEEKIICTGKYQYKDIAKLYTNIDLIWAVYPNNDYNVKYAISNKFFESIFFETPAIYANKTMLGELIEKENIGFCVDPYSSEEINKLLKNIYLNKHIITEKIKKLHIFKSKTKTWNEEFDDFYSILT